ncbi:MAG: 23S rRNA (guanosine(2251)-2'-O)-methyltransferase RlmB [Chromatiaceae bacterium]
MSSNFIIGIHAVRAALKHGRQRIDGMWFDAARNDRRLRQLLDQARAAGLQPEASDKAALDRLTAGANHQGIVAHGEMPASLGESALDELLGGLTTAPFLLVLDGVTDPHNLGACLRTADAAGVHAVIAPRDRASGLTPAACKVASGAAETVPYVQVTNLSRTLRHLQRVHRVFVVGTAAEAAAGLFDVDLAGPLALVLGAEGEGMRRLTGETCDQLVRLPMLGRVESLNVSVAAGICLYEALRQRRG